MGDHSKGHTCEQKYPLRVIFALLRFRWLHIRKIHSKCMSSRIQDMHAHTHTPTHPHTHMHYIHAHTSTHSHMYICVHGYAPNNAHTCTTHHSYIHKYACTHHAQKDGAACITCCGKPGHQRNNTTIVI